MKHRVFLMRCGAWLLDITLVEGGGQGEFIDELDRLS